MTGRRDCADHRIFLWPKEITSSTSSTVRPIGPRTVSNCLRALGLAEHPTQALLDAYTIQENRGGFKGEKVLIVGDVALQAERLRALRLEDVPLVD